MLLRMNNSDKIILHLCAEDGSDTLPYKEAGYDVRLVTKAVGVENYIPPSDKEIYGIIANPPCTHFSIARTTAKTPRDLTEGMRLVRECLRIIWQCQYKLTNEHQRKPSLRFWAIENPATGMLRWFLGKPVFEYCPSQYGANFTKRTALWGCFNSPHRPLLHNPVRTHRSLVGGITSGGDPARSICYYSFARLFYAANQ